MTIVAGYTVTGQNEAPIQLAVKLAATTGEPISVVSVVEQRPSAAEDPVEAEFRDLLIAQAQRSLSAATGDLPESVEVTTAVRIGPSTPQTLAEYAQEVGASVVVVGSSSSGLLGRIALGSVTNRVVHSAATPVAIAPLGYRAGTGPISRVTAAYGSNADIHGLIPSAVELAQRWGVPLRIVSFCVRDDGALRGDTPEGAESVDDKWWRKTQDGIRAQLEEVRSQIGGTGLEIEMGAGDNWPVAVEGVGWDDEELLVLGAGAAGPGSQVFLGTAAARILGASPVPVAILPRRE